MKIVLAQQNPTVGDLQGNIQIIRQVIERTSSDHPDLMIFSELFLTGYPPRDLLDRRDFIDAAGNALNDLLELSKHYPDVGILTGTIIPTGKKTGNGLYNAAVFIENGKLLFTQKKTLLPTYDVFDEARYFDPADDIDVFVYKNERLGIVICEDSWNDSELLPKGLYPVDPMNTLLRKNPTLLINLSASPFYLGKPRIRYELIHSHAIRFKAPFILVNQVGGNDELIFDGHSFMASSDGNLIAQLPGFSTEMKLIDTQLPHDSLVFSHVHMETSLHQCLCLGIGDYLHKCGFKKAVIGLSGGIDSAVVCALAASAIGPENVLGVAMPSRYSSKESVEDAEALANNLGIQFKIIPIDPIFQSYLDTLTPHFENQPPGVAEENIQARIRGNILMGLSNKFGYLALSTGNKSEMSVGYCTLYGDMSGGLSVIADVPKMMVYALARFINSKKAIIPERILTKPPSAELKFNQKDEDSLPPYETLDRILYLYLDKGYSRESIVLEGHDSAMVDWVINTVWKNEYKRRQAAPALKVTTKAFGMGRRMPIAAKKSI